jgi:hypothetical protein
MQTYSVHLQCYRWSLCCAFAVLQVVIVLCICSVQVVIDLCDFCDKTCRLNQ